MNIVALIPARAGSKRIPGKNTKLLAGHPLIAYTIAAAQQSGVFSRVLVSTDSRELVGLCDTQGWDVCIRPCVTADNDPDILWVAGAMMFVGPQVAAFAILRPTSPFRSAETIRRAWAQFKDTRGALDSIRAVERWDGPHPGKMWTYNHVTCRMFPVLKEWTAHAPYHSSPTQSLVPVVRQNASLEMAWADVLTRDIPTISGDEIAPFFTEGYEGFDLNTESDWREAERLIATGEATLPPVPVAGVSPAPAPQ